MIESACSIEFETYAAVREAFFNPDLSRTFDRRPFVEGNIREGVVSTAHGALHRARRRLENAQFRADILRRYERESAPSITTEILDRFVAAPPVDLFRSGLRLSLVLAAERLGIEVDRASMEQLDLFDREADGLAQMSEILDSKDPDRTRVVARQSLEAWARDFVEPSMARRRALIDRHGPNPERLPHDLLTVLMLRRDDPHLCIDSDAIIVRELATYIVGALHTNAMTLVNAVDILLTVGSGDSRARNRIVADRAYAQRWVHETLRMRPNTPRPKRHVETDTMVAGRPVRREDTVILNIARANRDPAIFGDTADVFDADRHMPAGVPRWGLSFGAGAHQCPGRSYAGGFPMGDDFDIGDDHLYGVVAVMLQDVVRRRVGRDPDRAPVPDTRTERYTWWLSYPVVLGSSRA